MSDVGELVPISVLGSFAFLTTALSLFVTRKILKKLKDTSSEIRGINMLLRTNKYLMVAGFPTLMVAISLGACIWNILPNAEKSHATIILIILFFCLSLLCVNIYWCLGKIPKLLATKRSGARVVE